MASLQRAVLMLRKLYLFRIPREIRNALRLLQDAYSEELDLNGSDTSSQGSIELGESEEVDFEEGRGEKYKGKTKAPRAKSQKSGGEQKPASENIERDSHVANKDKERTGASKGAVYSEANLEVV